MMFGPSGHVHDPPESLIFDFGSAELLQKLKENPKSLSTRVVLGNLRISKIDSLGKDTCRTSLTFVLSDLGTAGNDINIFKKTRIGNCVFANSIEETETIEIYF